ncbi:MAG: Extracellular solute-binding protein family 1 [Parcubacteria group bacterium GW2011_GWA1_47_8]|nr:MAG: Extracellular solute-binding protein family 1 [Parcubacteria group bacterium GW2011_GWA1_47_8]
MARKSIFQFVVLGIFGVMILVGMLAFSGKLPFLERAEENYGTVTLWGTFPQREMQTAIDTALQGEKRLTVKYVEKDTDTFDGDFVNALATGNGPDLILLSEDKILSTVDKLMLMPYTSYPERTFKGTFVEEGEMFLLPEGIAGIPFTLDPLVMYWNRDIFSSASLLSPPKKWTEFYPLAERIVARDTSGNISRSFVSFGEYKNVTHAKDIISLLIMQAGSNIVERGAEGKYKSTLTQAVGVPKLGGVSEPIVRAARFFTEFSKSNLTTYSWNRTLPYSRDMFEAGDLALYFGYASEYPSIKLRNPHLNFDIAPVPQPDTVSKRVTFGRMHGVAVVRASRNTAGAFQAAYLLTSAVSSGVVANTFNIPPVRRDLLGTPPANDATVAVTYDAAIIARGWHDPSPKETDRIFNTMVDNITSGFLYAEQALTTAQSAIDRILSGKKTP